MFLFFSSLVLLSSESARNVIQDFFAYGSVVVVNYPAAFVVFVVFLTILCTYATLMHMYLPALQSQQKVGKSEITGDTYEHQRAETIKTSSRPENIGILAMDVYFPSTYIKQSDLEVANSVSAGKYTKGLGQEGLAFVGDREDINSISLTVVQSLLEKYSVSPSQIGRVEIGTESLIDKSKSTKTVIMDLFKSSGNTDVEGVTNINACYGGTAAFLNSVAWVESSAWDGRYALVVAADIAVYADGPARPTGGCGAVAMLIGPNAPLVLEPGLRTTHASNVWDFYKPDPHSEYPTVDGSHSQACYLRALDDCYTRFCRKTENAGIVKNGQFDASTFDHAIFHSPYNKLVQKSFARLIFNDFLRNPSKPQYQELQNWRNAPIDKTYTDRDLDYSLRKISGDLYTRMVADSCRLSKQIGNTYTASVFCNIASLIDSFKGGLVDKSALVFSYGSGSMASMYALRGRQPSSRIIDIESQSGRHSASSLFTLDYISQVLDLQSRLCNRELCDPTEFVAHMDLREKTHGAKDYTPISSVDSLFPGTFYVDNISDKFQRVYKRKPINSTRKLGFVMSFNSESIKAATESELSSDNIAITGVGVGLPGLSGRIFEANNIERLLNGENCIGHVTNDDAHGMVKKNIVQLKKTPQGNLRLPVDSVEKTLKITARLRNLDLAEEYGIPKSLAGCMDKSSQVAVAAGLEALKKAGLVSGKIENGWGQWSLPESMRDSTGIVFATSFPALDAAVNEVERYFSNKNVQLRELLESFGTDSSDLSSEELEALKSLASRKIGEDYEFDRKFLFKVLVLANAQLAQIIGARGPNTQVNAACAGTTMAIGLAQDWLKAGRCDRVVVIAGDTASGPTLMQWIGSGFRALGAATLASKVEEGALPFDAKRNGMLLGSGAVGMVLEKESTINTKGLALPSGSRKCVLLGSQYSNSAYHGAALEKDHIAAELIRFLETIEKKHGITRSSIAKQGIYFSHETFTHASPTASCAFSEVGALKKAFGDDLSHMIIANTKGFTGHPMGVSFEDAAAVESLVSGRVPPVSNFKDHDANLGVTLNISTGGAHKAKYALRFAAGFGSQVAFTLFGLRE